MKSKKFLRICFLTVILFSSILFVQAKPNYQVIQPNQNYNYHEQVSEKSKILFIVDYSNSMNENLDGRSKLTVALDTMSRILPQIPDNVGVGLRVYGQRIGFTYMDGCRASQLLVPIGPFQGKRELIQNSLFKTKAVGWTPITYSLKQAVNKDFAGVAGPKHIILLTDGGETCDESPCTYVLELIKTRSDIKIDVIAFNLNDAEALSQLKCTALTTSGKFYSVDNASGLYKSLFDSLNIDKNVRGTIKVNP